MRTSNEMIHDSEIVQSNRTIPQSYFDFLKNMGAGDRANKSIMECFWHHRIMRWRITLFMWLLMMTVHNSRIIYNSLKKTNLSQTEFMKKLSSELCEINPNEHELVKLEKNKTLYSLLILLQKEKLHILRLQSMWTNA